MQAANSYFLSEKEISYKAQVSKPVKINRENLDPVRRIIFDRAQELGISLKDLSEKGADKSHAYMQQYLARGTPARLSESVREGVARMLQLDPDALKSGEMSPLSTGAKRSIAEVTALPILGKAQAGYWAEAEIHDFGFDPDTGESFEPTLPVVASTDYPERLQYALMLEGTSLNKVAKPGSFVVCVRLEGFPCDDGMKTLDGKLVHVERHKGDLIETTVKRLKFNGSGAELWPESSDPKHQSPIPLRENSARTSVQVMGVVIGLYQVL